MQSEVTITAKSEDSVLKKKFLCYEEIQVSKDCPELRKMVDQTLYEFKLEPEDVIVKITANW